MKKIYILLSCALLMCSCSDYYNTKNDPIVYGETYYKSDIQTDKSCYNPNEVVKFTLKNKPDGEAKVRYSYLGNILEEITLPASSWSWTPPSADFKGYMAEIYQMVEGKEKILHSIAIDVSSDWTKFPRYGFLSSYGDIPKSKISSNIETLNRYHINGIQFYDWLYEHQKPLAGTVSNPAASWLDLIGRTNYLSTVQGYIEASHERGMKAMFYNLAFGALKNASTDGVEEEWYLFKDSNHEEKDYHHLDAPFRSSIYLLDPANTYWQKYLAGRNKDVYEVFEFDGFHIDQLGNRGTVYDYDGNIVKLNETFKAFIAEMKNANPNKYLVMNAVSQYGQKESIAKSATNFLYTEVWDECKRFDELSQIIIENNKYCDNTKATVLAAYMDYAKSNGQGYVNQPGVLLTNAVIFSFGGAHIELGEHYLANEYYPNNNLAMKSALKESLTCYYDFLVAYQNILRDGGTFADINVESIDGSLDIKNWPVDKGQVAVVGKQFSDMDIVHLINFTDANSMDWRDTNGTQTEPSLRNNVELKINVRGNISNVKFASPDVNGGVAKSIVFTQSGNYVNITLPSLKYWDMIILEY